MAKWIRCINQISHACQVFTRVQGITVFEIGMYKFFKFENLGKKPH